MTSLYKYTHEKGWFLVAQPLYFMTKIKKKHLLSSIFSYIPLFFKSFLTSLRFINKHVFEKKFHNSLLDQPPITLTFDATTFRPDHSKYYFVLVDLIRFIHICRYQLGMDRNSNSARENSIQAHTSYIPYTLI